MCCRSPLASNASMSSSLDVSGGKFRTTSVVWSVCPCCWAASSSKWLSLLVSTHAQQSTSRSRWGGDDPEHSVEDDDGAEAMAGVDAPACIRASVCGCPAGATAAVEYVMSVCNDFSILHQSLLSPSSLLDLETVASDPLTSPSAGKNVAVSLTYIGLGRSFANREPPGGTHIVAGGCSFSRTAIAAIAPQACGCACAQMA
mmetsp:Transcript_146390/g.469697  ORF Transcript_146390/g.469697 Transcript_146390/m.469697 type:complete len:201 (-) Transcript_146390:3-605(-)